MHPVQIPEPLSQSSASRLFDERFFDIISRMIITKVSPFNKKEIEKQKKKNNFIALSSLAMDLERVSMGLYRKSYKMADRFAEEALLRRKEIDKAKVQPYIAKLLDNLEQLLKSTDDQRKAEDAMMYSTLFQNAAMKT